jgi:hypothetical protein
MSVILKKILNYIFYIVISVTSQVLCMECEEQAPPHISGTTITLTSHDPDSAPDTTTESIEGLTPIPSEPYPYPITRTSTFIHDEVVKFIAHHATEFSFIECEDDDYELVGRYRITPQEAPVLHTLFNYLWDLYITPSSQTPPPPIYIQLNCKLSTGDTLVYKNAAVIMQETDAQTYPFSVIPYLKGFALGEEYVYKLKKDILIASVLVHEIGHIVSHHIIAKAKNQASAPPHWYTQYILNHFDRRYEQLANKLAIQHDPDAFIELCERTRKHKCSWYDRLVAHVTLKIMGSPPYFLSPGFFGDCHPSETAQLRTALCYKYYHAKKKLVRDQHNI